MFMEFLSDYDEELVQGGLTLLINPVIRPEVSTEISNSIELDNALVTAVQNNIGTAVGLGVLGGEVSISSMMSNQLGVWIQS